MAARAAARPPPEVIDLMSDSSDTESPARHTPAPLEIDENGDLSPMNQPPGMNWGFFDFENNDEGVPLGLPVQREPMDLDTPESDSESEPEPRPESPVRGQIINIDGEDVFIPDEIEPGPAPPAAAFPDFAVMPGAFGDEAQAAPSAAENDLDFAMTLSEEFTEDTCLQRVLEIFPDISHEHVITLYRSYDGKDGYQNMSNPARLDNIIEQLVSGTNYPKQEKPKQPMRKRKREDSIDVTDTKRWEREDREAQPTFTKGSMQAMLKADFPEITVQLCNETLAAQKHFYQAYIALANLYDGRGNATRPIGRGRPKKNVASADIVALNSGWPPLVEELAAARARVQIIRAQQAAEDARKHAEQENLQRAKERGETAECNACFDDLPLNRQIHCDGNTAHFTCYECAETYIKSEIGEARCRVLCTAGCGAPFPPNQLNLLSDKGLLEKLAELEQEKAIRDAGLEDLEECPFCDYKAIVPPLEEDFEFRCANPECEKVSCRRCKSVSHIPISCEQHAKDNQIDHRHKIEEAMTAALLRACNKCKKQFIKEYGCNKMTCPSCANVQCYICSESLHGYEHFDQAPNRPVTGATAKRCPLYDNVEERHEREVKEAESAARAQVLADNPNVQQDALEFKVSDAVKKATDERIKKAGGVGGNGVGYAGFDHAVYPHGGYPGLAGGHRLGGGVPLDRAQRAALGLDGAAYDDDDDDEEQELVARMRRAVAHAHNHHGGAEDRVRRARERLAEVQAIRERMQQYGVARRPYALRGAVQADQAAPQRPPLPVYRGRPAAEPNGPARRPRGVDDRDRALHPVLPAPEARHAEFAGLPILQARARGPNDAQRRAQYLLDRQGDEPAADHVNAYIRGMPQQDLPGLPNAAQARAPFGVPDEARRQQEELLQLQMVAQRQQHERQLAMLRVRQQGLRQQAEQNARTRQRLDEI